MTEQQIDAEIVARGYEPTWFQRGTGFGATQRHDWWSEEFVDGKCALSRDLFRALKGGRKRRAYRTYPTREAAFADLRAAIRAAHLTPVSE